MPILGLDVGSPQGNISLADWRTIHQQGRRFVYIRCAEALGTVDPRFAANVAGAKAVGLNAGPYLVGHPNVDAVKQATAHFGLAKGLGTNPGDLPPALDLELSEGLTPDAVQAWTRAYINAASLLWRRTLVLYTYENFDHTMLTCDDPTIATTHLWMAWYNPSTPPVPKPWTSASLWQSGGGKTYHTPAGCPCDEDVCLLDEAGYADLCDPTVQVVVPLSAEIT
jgi:lysozyme